VPADQAETLLVDEASARRRIRSLLAGAHRGTRLGTRPDAIVTGSDRLAAVIYGVAGELRLRIGRDLGVTGFDGSIAATLGDPSRNRGERRLGGARRRRPGGG
jgi:DNA-binding LacI/PurR family transcriptional regulator